MSVMRSSIALVILIALGGGIPDLRAQQDQDSFGNVTICALCHQRIPLAKAAVLPLAEPDSADKEPADVGPSEFWPASMMAHAARDPYWKAKVQFETAKLPAMKETIEDTCLRCHAPMQQYNRRVSGGGLALSELNRIGEQGVGCTVCHQITPKGFGEKVSFEGGFEINDEYHAYGPHENPFSHPMEMHTDYLAVEGKHVTESALCATCHTVITPTVDESGKVVGEFVEQAPYLEWLVSDLADLDTTCQSCHMPVLKDAQGKETPQYIAHRPFGDPFPPTRPRKPFGLHYLAGGNVPMLNMLKEVYPDETSLLSGNVQRTSRFLADALSLVVKGKRADGVLRFSVEVTNNTGHKLPTGFPSRRIWLHVRVADAAGAVLFESGAWDAKTGEIAELRDLELHHARIIKPEHVMVYEAEMADTRGEVTVSLLRAASYVKDNRLLPSGFDTSKPLPNGIHAKSISPVGTGHDPAFIPGGHTVIYEVAPGTATGPFRVSVEALYQSIKPAHAAAMAGGASTAEREFQTLFTRHNNPVSMTLREITIR